MAVVGQFGWWIVGRSDGGVCRLWSGFRGEGEEAEDGFCAGVEVAEVELFVGGVEVVVGEAEAHEEGGDAEVALEVADDGDGAAAADEDGVFAEDVVHGLGGCGDEGVVGVEDGGVALVDEADLCGGARRA